MVTLFGAIVKQTEDGRFLFNVDSSLGDAAAVGLAGPVWFANRQLVEPIYEARFRGDHDRIRISYELASLKAAQIVSDRQEMC